MKIVRMGRMKMIGIVPFEDASWDFSNVPITNVFWTISNVMEKMNVVILGKNFVVRNDFTKKILNTLLIYWFQISFHGKICKYFYFFSSVMKQDVHVQKLTCSNVLKDHVFQMQKDVILNQTVLMLLMKRIVIRKSVQKVYMIKLPWLIVIVQQLAFFRNGK